MKVERRHLRRVMPRSTRRPSFWRPLVVFAICCGLLGSLGGLARAADDESDGEPDWLPSVALNFGVLNQDIDGRAETTAADIPNGTGDSLISEYFEVEGRLDMPPLSSGRNAPRFFVMAGFQLPLADDLVADKTDFGVDSVRNPLASSPNPGPEQNPDFLANCPTTFEDPTGVANDTIISETCSVSTRNKMTINALWYIGLGINVPFEIEGMRFHLAPSFQYYGFDIQASGEFNRQSVGAAFNADRQPGEPAVWGGTQDERITEVGSSDAFHGVAVQLDLSADVYEAKPWRWSMYLQGRAAFVLTERDITARRSQDGNDFVWRNNLVDDGGLNIPVNLQIGGGVRIQWMGM